MNHQNIEFAFDSNNLYREESITDMKVGAIRCLIPIKPDGTPDLNRKTVYAGHSQLMTESGMIPIEAPLEAANLDQAISAFPKAMQTALQEMVEELQKLQEEHNRRQQREQSRIITPGR